MTSSIVKDGIKASKIIDVFNDYDFIQLNKNIKVCHTVNIYHLIMVVIYIIIHY